MNAIEDFLIFYQNQLNETVSLVCARRRDESTLLPEFGSTKHYTSEITLMELNVHVSLLTNQIKLLAAICLTQSFIEQQLDND